MIRTEKCIVMDIDGTLCPLKQPSERYEDLQPYPEMVALMREYRANGFWIILATSRSMRTYDGNVGLILANTAGSMLSWLDRHSIPYDEIQFGKPWPGKGGFYVDDRSIRPSEFRTLGYEQIRRLLEQEQQSTVAA